MADAPTTSDRPEATRARYWSYRHPQPSAAVGQLVATDLDDLGTVIHHGFGGRRDPAAGLRCLVVGDGTGDATLFLAHQLAKNALGEVVHLHDDEAATEAVRRRAGEAGLERTIRWLRGGPEAIGRLGLEGMDYINGGDVPSRSNDPPAALRNLVSALSESGVLALNLPGRIAHLGVEHVRKMLGILREAETGDDGSVDFGHRAGLPQKASREARDLLSALVPPNWHRRAEEMFVDVDQLSDEELNSLFVATPYRSFSVDEIYDLLEPAGLHLLQFGRMYRMLYEPAFTFGSERIRQRVAGLPKRGQQAACELFWCAILSHRFWVARRPVAPAAVTDLDLVPRFTFVGRSIDVGRSIRDEDRSHWKLDVPLPGQLSVSAVLPANDVVKALVNQIDGRRTTREILDAVHRQGSEGKLREPEDSPTSSLAETFYHVLTVLARFDLVALGLPAGGDVANRPGVRI